MPSNNKQENRSSSPIIKVTSVFPSGQYHIRKDHIERFSVDPDNENNNIIVLTSGDSYIIKMTADDLIKNINN